MYPLKPNYSSLKSMKNYIKYSGLKKYLGCKPYKSEYMKNFHKQVNCRFAFKNKEYKRKHQLRSDTEVCQQNQIQKRSR